MGRPGWVTYACLMVLAVAALVYAPVLALDHVVTERVEVPQPAPSASTPVAEMTDRLGVPQGTVPGSQINPQLPGTCDVYQGDTWIVLFCH